MTDSGGFQVFSLAKRVKITDEGASFNNHIDGALLNFTPENVADIQTRAGVDIQMVLDVCPPAYCSEKELLKALDSTTRWAKRARKAFLEHPKRKEGQLQFGIVQGELNLEKRKEHLLEIMDIDFDGIAIGGLSVGESNQEMYEVLDYLSEFLPKEKAHYLMGVGTPADLCYGVWKGIDMFDCVMPSRNARNGYLFTENGPIQIKNAKFKDDLGPIDENCDCPVCKRYSRAYLRHLFINKELSVYRYLTIHNLHFYKKLVGKIRKAVAEGTIESLFRHYQSLYPGRKKSPSS